MVRAHDVIIKQSRDNSKNPLGGAWFAVIGSSTGMYKLNPLINGYSGGLVGAKESRFFFP